MAIKALALASALTVALGAPSLAMAQSAAQPTVVEKMPMYGALSRAQLISLLESHGYKDIRLSSETPTQTNPHPETHPHENLTPQQAATTPVHLGWNGTATKSGELVNIYLVAQAPERIPEQYGATRDPGRIMVYLDHVGAGAHEEQSGSTRQQ